MLWFLWPAGGVGIQRQQQREKERGGERQRALREWQMERNPSWLAQNEDKFYVARKLRSLFIVSVHSSLSNACAAPPSHPSLPLSVSFPHHFTSLPQVNILSFSAQGKGFANDSTNASILTTRASPSALSPPPFARLPFMLLSIWNRY